MALGIIGGSGLYGLHVEDAEWRDADTPWGPASDALLHGRLGTTEIVFLPRHGRGHTLAPSEINYRANIAALKAAGVTAIVSLSACGSFRDDLAPGSFVVIDQLVDRTRGRVTSFFGDGIVAHVSLADPFCASLGDAIGAAAPDCVRGGTYLAMAGPQFSTRAESRLYRAAGLDVIGMTAAPEAALAREAELCYATVAMVTDYDSWRSTGEAVDVAAILSVLGGNAARAAALVAGVAAGWSYYACGSGCSHALDHAVITERGKWPAATVERLQGVAGRVLR
ncbi:S-methyl-5'-thioadenosine phosphorylase [uncultured Sphingomonas sp.]|uniref:phosphorylase family protein n=1 Tax=uncultured Sphingomonas sp. TaxID=158754 RepID=UPI0035C9653E